MDVLRHIGYQNTPLLWSKDDIYGLRQFAISSKKELSLYKPIEEKLRLGNRVERFVSSELKQQHNISIISENVQINNSNITIGELDCLFFKEGKPIHLEIVFKFYLYDPDVGNDHLEHWIGPNRNDSLIEKLEKLKQHQLPLLYHPQTEKTLSELNLEAHNIQQFVHFKAQLFMPYSEDFEEESHKILVNSPLNKECLRGWYIRTSELHLFQDCRFYIPAKLNWLVDTHDDVGWINFSEFKTSIKLWTVKNRSPLCWIKFPNGQLQKFFVVWWS